jgi:hypothetical protein
MPKGVEHSQAESVIRRSPQMRMTLMPKGAAWALMVHRQEQLGHSVPYER